MEDKRIIVCVDELLLLLMKMSGDGYAYCEVKIDKQFINKPDGKHHTDSLRIEAINNYGADRVGHGYFPVIDAVPEEEISKYGENAHLNSKERIWFEKINAKVHYPPTYKNDEDEVPKVATLKRDKNKTKEQEYGYEVYVKVRKTPILQHDETNNNTDYDGYDEDNEDDDYDYDDEYDEDEE